MIMIIIYCVTLKEIIIYVNIILNTIRPPFLLLHPFFFRIHPLVYPNVELWRISIIKNLSELKLNRPKALIAYSRNEIRNEREFPLFFKPFLKLLRLLHSTYIERYSARSSLGGKSRRPLRLGSRNNADLIRGRSSNFYGVGRGQGATVAMTTWRNIHVIDKAQRPGRTFLAGWMIGGWMGWYACEFSIRSDRFSFLSFPSLFFSCFQAFHRPKILLVEVEKEEEEEGREETRCT